MRSQARRAAISKERGGDLIELLRVSALGALDAAGQLGRARGQCEEADVVCLAGLLEGALELGTAVDLDGPDGEGHAGNQAVGEAHSGGDRGPGVGSDHVPAGDDVAGREVFEHHAGDGAHVQGVHLDEVAGLATNSLERDPCIQSLSARNGDSAYHVIRLTYEEH